MKTTVLIEAFDLSEVTKEQINVEARTIPVKLIVPGMSQNRRHYSEAVIQKAAALFEGTKAYSDHPTRAEAKDRPERRTRDITGWYTDVEYKEGALRAVRHFTRTQAGQDSWALAQDVIEGRAPASLFGLSINAVGKGSMRRMDDGSEALIVESIDVVNSVDDVTTPAAGGGFERLLAGGGDDLTSDLLRAVSYEELIEARPDVVERFKKEWQTVRQSEAVKAANAVADQAKRALQEAQERVTALTTERDAAQADAAQARRELLVVETLAGVNLPRSYKDDLRKKLSGSAPEGWKALVEHELKKAKDAGVEMRVNVSGAGQQVQDPTPDLTIEESLSAQPDEDVAAYMARIQRQREARKG